MKPKSLLIALAVVSQLCNPSLALAAPACEMSRESLVERQRHISAQTQLLKKQSADSEKALKELRKSEKVHKGGSIIKAIGEGLLAIASTVIPGLSTITKWVTDTGIPTIAKALKPSKSDAATPGVILVIEGKKIYARDSAEALAWIEARLEELEKLSLARGLQLVDFKMPFLNDKCVDNYTCPTDSRDVEELMVSIARWYQKASAQKLDSAVMLSDVQLPFVLNTLRALKIKSAYFGQLSEALADRASGCGLDSAAPRVAMAY